ncbi:sodium/potassium/calcium exchanger 1-like isoform X2 [Micropterus dolomieu]|uniref:sodium/potassium/calcium exchanger 1-like isoform X1 n=1 Tax=Micropterus dolomieu TaxID=147949 RepID=UPI001E8EBF14|nr:sodium/potassium/calcium exchanger 1-like isoform X1 [Micropterus dolomieu]XP_045889574.1 sodium/potassium/calcium exchanger 1-like isoform X2 [Micropterus dolomieu]
MNVHSPPRRRLRRSRVLFFISGVLLCFVYTLTLKARLSQPRASAQTDDTLGAERGDDDVVEVNIREVMASNETAEEVVSTGATKPPLVIIVNSTDIEQCIYVDPHPPKPPPTPPPPTTTAAPGPPLQPPHRKGDYPEDIFSVEQRRQGWVVLHVTGMIYMFVALAIVCDEFFVPGLEVITNKLEISDDVAGATFMAAGGSAPELFTSLIGVFISHSNVGIGTIVGSAVFNILFVIGMCAIFSREMLHLTWWPLFRDVTFYILDLVMLIVFFLDNMILWWESLLLLMGYISYVSFMKFNSQIEQGVKSQLNKHMSIVKVWTAEEPEKESEAPPAPPPSAAAPPAAPPAAPSAAPKAEEKSKREPEPLPSSPQRIKSPSDLQEDRARLRVRPVLQRGGSSASLHNTSLRSTIFQLMIHTLDPLGEESEIQKPNAEQAAAASAAVAPGGAAAAEPSTSQPQKTEEKSEKETDQPDESKAAAGGSEGSDGGGEDESGDEESSDSSESEEEEEEDDDDDGKKEEEEEEEENEPLSLEWPETRRKQATYLFLLPIVFPLWLTLPDVRNVASRRYFAVTFIGSILWIGVFSYLMVWWAHQVGETMGISEEIMGLTILAAGTSIPDLITSVIVARKGLGDMAVSSSVGSNIFDITVGLPVPWLIYTLLHNGEPVTVSSNGLFCAIVLLFLMLLFVIISIAACRWKMSRKLGLTMFVLYFVFLVLSVMLEDRILICPVSI